MSYALMFGSLQQFDRCKSFTKNVDVKLRCYNAKYNNKIMSIMFICYYSFLWINDTSTVSLFWIKNHFILSSS